MVVSQKALRQTPTEQPPPQEQTHPPGSRHTPGADNPLRADTSPGSRRPPGEQTPPRADPLGADPPGSRHPPRSRPPQSRPPGIRSTSGRYASYWNAFLFENNCNYLSSKLALILIIDLIAALLSETRFEGRVQCSGVNWKAFSEKNNTSKRLLQILCAPSAKITCKIEKSVWC